MYLKYNFQDHASFEKDILGKKYSQNTYIFNKKNKLIILSGKFYYFKNKNIKTILFNKNKTKQLSFLINKHDIINFVNNVEGEYFGVEFNRKNKSLKVFSDKLKQLELFYFYNDKFFLFSDDVKEIIKEIGIKGYNAKSLISAILLYVPKGHMIFQDIYRLRYNEIIEVNQGKVFVKNFNDNSIENIKYSEKDLLIYNNIIRNSILSRASKNGLNLVMISGGWDSTLILGLLTKYFDKDKIRGVTIKVVASNGHCFNKFEVAKAKKISNILGIKIDVVEVNYGKKELSCKFNKAIEEIFLNNLFFSAPASWQTFLDHIRKKYGKDVVIFQGEASDSLHNYGFSQYISLPHDDINFLEYADKMKNYLFSPAFFKKIKKDNFLDDTVYKIFLYFNRNKKFISIKKINLKEKIYYYLLSFIFSDVRVPFRKIENKFIKNASLKNFNNWLKKEYFQKVVNSINEDNLYYYFSRLYMDFHLQNHSIRIYRVGLENMRFPYLDSNLFRFLYKMPQNFGRGLDFNRIKFPLKMFAKEVLPNSVIEVIEKGPHSYLSEVEKFNIYNEYFLNGSIYEYMKKIVDFKKCEDVFDPQVFNLVEIKNFIKDFKRGNIKNISQSDSRLLLILVLLSAYGKK